MEGICELIRLDDLERIFAVRDALQAHGIDAVVWGCWPHGDRRLGTSNKLRLMVRRRDLVNAQWVARAAGVDAWWDEPRDAPGRTSCRETG
ncbi:MAG: hypothetical protein ACXVP1_00505 [Thermoleophilia bacterium]